MKQEIGFGHKSLEYENKIEYALCRPNQPSSNLFTVEITETLMILRI